MEYKKQKINEQTKSNKNKHVNTENRVVVLRREEKKRKSFKQHTLYEHQFCSGMGIGCWKKKMTSILVLLSSSRGMIEINIFVQGTARHKY